MKTFKKTYLPLTIEHNGKTYKRVASQSDEEFQKTIDNIKTKKCTGNFVICEVLQKNLKGKLDLHGKPYQPTKWLFMAEKTF